MGGGGDSEFFISISILKSMHDPFYSVLCLECSLLPHISYLFLLPSL